ncbi:sensor histidine kinase [Treponema sp.]|uniref:sensor histidine kinase n=1 Tax=Treponema sp. TaxID=166 RepID=UPI00298E3B5A|nr:histidine kinase [Treponema sp.]MCR5612575.1 histidine kinase [Treponema sp.]
MITGSASGFNSTEKKSFSKRILRFLQNYSIRSQILTTFFLSCIILGFIVILSTNILRRTMTTVGNSYQTNADLDKYLIQLSETETAMETYMQYRTFESIDKYYHYLALAEETAAKLQNKPSSVTIRQKEYIIKQLSTNFFSLSGNAIGARRSNNTTQIDFWYNKTLECYSFLHEEILSLDMLYFTSNAQTYESNKESTTTLMNTSIVLMFTILLCAIMFIYISISRITQPLSNISSVALKVADRDFNVELFNSPRHDEIGNICRAFDAMIISIREYIDTIWQKAKQENELREKEIEMRALITDAHFKALQEQIQPHFLFNTLNTGAGLALMEGADKTCYFLEQVADFLRYNIQHPGHDATIKDELGMLDNYIYIMEVRFGNRYEFIKEVDDSTLMCRMPNMILQPLVENCIKHGLKDITENGKIKIIVQKKTDTDEINILISDNGCGFDSQIKEQILNSVNSSEPVIVNSEKINQNEHISTGLVNVISRLQFYFKRKDVFAILDGENGKGTTFFIKIPDV